MDRAPYALNVPGAGAAPGIAAGGATAAPHPEPPSSAAELQRAQEVTALRLRRLEYEQRINELVRERDAWKLHAQRLQAELPASRSGAPLLLPPPAMR